MPSEMLYRPTDDVRVLCSLITEGVASSPADQSVYKNIKFFVRNDTWFSGPKFIVLSMMFDENGCNSFSLDQLPSKATSVTWVSPDRGNTDAPHELYDWLGAKHTYQLGIIKTQVLPSSILAEQDPLKIALHNLSLGTQCKKRCAQILEFFKQAARQDMLKVDESLLLEIFNTLDIAPPSRGVGFTILELTIVLAVIAALMGGMIALSSAALEGRSYNGTATKLKILQQALADYRIAHNRLPCPAASSTVTSGATFGVEVATTSPCTGADSASTVVAIGMVPTRTLGLPDEMAIDSWGRRIRYAVSTPYVDADAFSTYAATDATARLTVNNNNNNTSNTATPNLTTTALFVLVSYGKDGHGGYTGGLNGSAASTLVNGGITNTNQLLNCKCTSAAVADFATVANNKIFVQGDEKPDPASSLNNFDDLVVFSTRAGLRNATE